ncbi:TauD/TfdA dioxygenase family protein [Amycolatopsis lurida]
MKVTELTPTTGVEVASLTGSRLIDSKVADQCVDWLKKRGVVIYREADLNDDELVAFSRLLGNVVRLPNGGDPDHPEIQQITRDPAKSKLAVYREATFFWHIDGTSQEVPDRATLLTARQVSDDGGGDTEFANTYAAYESLPADKKEQLDGVRVVHSFTASQLLVYPDPSPKERAAWDRNPAREHPVVWTHRDGRKSLLIGATAGKIVGLPPEEGRALLDQLLAWSTQPQFVVRHQWRPGDLVIWDNTIMLHRALPYSESSARLMHRTSLAGEEAVA